MKNTGIKTFSVISAAAAFVIISGCASREAALPVPAESASVSAHETTEELRPAAASVMAEFPAVEEDSEDTESQEDLLPSEPVAIGTATVEKISPIESASYPCSTILVCTDENADDEKIHEITEKFGLSILYDYENFNMYAFSTPEPLDKDATVKLLDALTAYDFILSAEPDQVIYPYDPIEPTEPVDMVLPEIIQ